MHESRPSTVLISNAQIVGIRDWEYMLNYTFIQRLEQFDAEYVFTR